MFTGDPTHRYGPPYMVRPWMGMQGFTSLHQCHGTLRRSYGSMEGNLFRQISGMARAAHLLRRADGIHFVFASAYGTMIPTVRGELWEDLILLCGAFPNVPTLIGGDFNVTLAAADRPNDAGGRDQGSARFREVLAQLGIGEMGPTNKRFTWRGPTSQSRINRFLYTPELLDIHTLAEVISLPRPLSDHTPLLWASQAGPAKPTYFKMNRSWFRRDGIKAGIEGWWRNHTAFGSATARLAKKLLQFRHHLFEFRRQLRSNRTRCRDVALARIQELDTKEDTHPLEPGEIQERKICRDEVVEVDLRVEMD